MPQLMSVWSNLEPRRQIIVALASIAMFAAVLTLSSMATAPAMSLLYAGLESGAAGEVVAALEKRGVPYEVRSGAIFVDSNKRDELRMTLASEGLPAANSAGYELLDSLSGFGTTSQMFDAAYWRAKEGELARTIVSSPHIRGARVHIATPSSQPFRRKAKTTASVTVTTAAGSLSAAHAKALKFLVSSAVAGLSPDDVAIIDAQGGLIMGADETGMNAGGQNRTAELKKSVERLLEARVGYGNAVVEVSLETVTDRESIIERKVDPESRAVISTDTEERSTASEDAKGGNVSVASNLPEGDGATDSNSSSKNSETRERVNYEVSEIQREILKSPGAIKRLTVAVLVDGTRTVDDSGAEAFNPRTEQELTELRELVAAAVGFNEARGDIITVKSLEFKPIVEQGSTADTSMMQSLDLNLMTLIQIAVLAVVALILGLFVVRPILKGKPSTSPATSPAGLPAPAGNGAAPGFAGQNSGPEMLPALTGEIDERGMDMPEMATVSNIDMPGTDVAPLTDLPMAETMDEPPTDPVARLRQMIEERQDETVEVLRSWMEEKTEGVS
ncbi:MAG: flagellar M-ring protein FliF [Rhodobacterales bacterium]|nr:MAG: flagellar M-ring protein FliF [Rhodobacterales bacterium]